MPETITSNAPYTLTVIRPRGGKIWGAGIDCGTTAAACQVTMQGSVVIGLLATPDQGYAFSNWTDDCAGTDPSFALALNGPRTCGAAFAPTGISTNTRTSPVITWTTPATITQGTALSAAQLNAAANVAGSFLYSPPAGTVLAAGTHTLSVKFTPADTTLYNTATASRSLVVNAATKVTPYIEWATPAAITQGTPLTAAQLNAAAKVPGAFVYSPPAGTVLAAGTHTLSVRFTPADTTLYNTATTSRNLVVRATTKITPYIAWATPAAITQGTPLTATQLNAVTKFAGTFAYSPLAGTVLTAGTHTLSVTFTPADTTLYNTATASRTIVVNATTKVTPYIAWATPAAITQGTPLTATQLNATAKFAGAFVYSPPAGTVLPAGAHTLSVAFMPSDTAMYNTATASRTIVVDGAARIIPHITWPTPAAITQGTPLTATELNATASVEGSFAYSPAAGTVLPAGTHVLSVRFTPADTSRYETGRASRTLVVTAVGKSAPVITWPAPTPITHGTALSAVQLNATANVAGSFAYTPAAGTMLAAGTHTLSVTFTPADTTRYTTAVVTSSLVVKASPTAPPPEPPVPGSIEIRLERLFEGTDTIGFGLPLARGAAVDPSSITVYIGAAPIAAAVTPLLHDHDAAGNVTGLRAVRIQFPASLMPGPTLTVSVMLGAPGGSPAGTVVPFSAVSAESPETVTVADRTIVNEGGTYRLAESNRRTLTLFTGREPAVLALYPPGYLAKSGILGPQVTAAELATDPAYAGLKFFSDDLAPFVRSAAYEETYALNPAPTSVVDPVASYEGWLYDRCATLLTGYVHADDPTILRHALRACSYYSSKIGLEGPSRGFFSGKPTPDNKYSHLRGLFAYYALTGDEGALAAGTAIADLWFKDPYFTGPYRRGAIRGVDKLWTERLLGTSLEGLYYGFRLTDNTAYLTAFKEVVATAYRHITTTDQAELVAITKDPNSPPFPAQNCFVHNALQAAEGNRSQPWCSGWMSELVVDSLLAYQDQTNDPRVDEIFVRLARFLRDVGSSYLARDRQDDSFLAPAVCFDPAAGFTAERRLIPLYGSGLYADGTRHNAGEYSDVEHCPDATALTAAAVRALVRQGKFDRGGPIGPFASEGESLLQLHHEFAFCAQITFKVRHAAGYHDPSVWTSSKLAAGASDPAAFIAKYGIGFPSYVTSPQRKLSWWFNTSMLQFGLLKDAGIKVSVLRPGVVQPKGQPCPSR